MIKKIFVLLLLAMLALTCVYAVEESPTQVQVGVYLLSLGKLDIATGTYTADFYLSLKCENNCTADQFEFVNGRAASTDKIIDTPTEKFYRIQANLNTKINLKGFPFDEQELPIIIEDKRNTKDVQIYVADLTQSGIDDSISFTGWNLKGWNASVLTHAYPVYNEEYSQYVFMINIEKIKWNSFIKTFLPVIFIVLVVLASFILDPDKINQRLTMVGSSLVAAVMFHVSITNQIPPVSYLTFADKFMMVTYFVLLASFAINVTLLELLELKKDKLVHKIHRATEYSMFIVVPIVYALMFLLMA